MKTHVDGAPGSATERHARSVSRRETAGMPDRARTWRERTEQGFTLLGIALIVVPVLSITNSGPVIGAVLLGVLLLGAGVRGLAYRMLPEEREYLGLRMEAENFLRLMRELNRLALDGDEAGLQVSKDRLHRQVERIARAAGWSSKGIRS